MTPFEQLLKERIGLDAASVGANVIERAVRQRQAACGTRDPQAYLERLQSSEAELQELIEAVVVPETWFFRDREAFAALAGVVLHEWLQAQRKAGNGDGVLRLLSLPCSSGEEAYSMSMALLATGLPPDRFQIDAIDVSTRALALGGTGIYGPNSFRGGDTGYRERYFEWRGPTARVTDAARAPVRFRHGNLFEMGAEHYDVIFCRNVLIYFDRPTQDRAVQILTRLLAPTGFLFVGPSETGLLLSHDLASARLPFAFAFRRAGSDAPRRAVLPPPVPVSRARSAPPPTTAPAPPRRTAPPAAPGLPEALQLANQGQLAAAARICEDHLRRLGPGAEVFHLMALIRDAGGDDGGAADYYRKALYLDPHHPEALAHLALLLERQGDPAGARVLRQRAQRPVREGHK